MANLLEENDIELELDLDTVGGGDMEGEGPSAAISVLAAENEADPDIAPVVGVDVEDDGRSYAVAEPAVENDNEVGLDLESVGGGFSGGGEESNVGAGVPTPANLASEADPVAGGVGANAEHAAEEDDGEGANAGVVTVPAIPTWVSDPVAESVGANTELVASAAGGDMEGEEPSPGAVPAAVNPTFVADLAAADVNANTVPTAENEADPDFAPVIGADVGEDGRSSADAEPAVEDGNEVGLDLDSVGGGFAGVGEDSNAGAGVPTPANLASEAPGIGANTVHVASADHGEGAGSNVGTVAFSPRRMANQNGDAVFNNAVHVALVGVDGLDREHFGGAVPGRWAGFNAPAAFPSDLRASQLSIPDIDVDGVDDNAKHAADDGDENGLDGSSVDNEFGLDLGPVGAGDMVGGEGPNVVAEAIAADPAIVADPAADGVGADAALTENEVGIVPVVGADAEPSAQSDIKFGLGRESDGSGGLGEGEELNTANFGFAGEVLTRDPVGCGVAEEGEGTNVAYFALAGKGGNEVLLDLTVSSTDGDTSTSACSVGVPSDVSEIEEATMSMVENAEAEPSYTELPIHPFGDGTFEIEFKHPSPSRNPSSAPSPLPKAAGRTISSVDQPIGVPGIDYLSMRKDMSCATTRVFETTKQLLVQDQKLRCMLELLENANTSLRAENSSFRDKLEEMDELTRAKLHGAICEIVQLTLQKESAEAIAATLAAEVAKMNAVVSVLKASVDEKEVCVNDALNALEVSQQEASQLDARYQNAIMEARLASQKLEKLKELVLTGRFLVVCAECSATSNRLSQDEAVTGTLAALKRSCQSDGDLYGLGGAAAPRQTVEAPLREVRGHFRIAPEAGLFKMALAAQAKQKRNLQAQLLAKNQALKRTRSKQKPVFFFVISLVLAVCCFPYESLTTLVKENAAAAEDLGLASKQLEATQAALYLVSAERDSAKEQAKASARRVAKLEYELSASSANITLARTQLEATQTTLSSVSAERDIAKEQAKSSAGLIAELEYELSTSRTNLTLALAEKQQADMKISELRASSEDAAKLMSQLVIEKEELASAMSDLAGQSNQPWWSKQLSEVLDPDCILDNTLL